MGRSFLRGVVLGSVAASIVLVAGTALAGTGIGAVFNLGKTNTVNRTSYLSAKTTGKVLHVTNKGTGPALGLSVRAGRPPLTVNSAARVARLNADTVDGMHGALAARLLMNDGQASRLFTLPGIGRVQLNWSSPQWWITFTNTSDQGVAAWASPYWNPTPSPADFVMVAPGSAISTVYSGLMGESCHLLL